MLHPAGWYQLTLPGSDPPLIGSREGRLLSAVQMHQGLHAGINMIYGIHYQTLSSDEGRRRPRHKVILIIIIVINSHMQTAALYCWGGLTSESPETEPGFNCRYSAGARRGTRRLRRCIIFIVVVIMKVKRVE